MIDAQTTKNTDTTAEKGYDSGKRYQVLSAMLAFDSNGLPHALHITTASISDKGGACNMVTTHREDLRHVQKVLIDGGYIGQPFADAM